MAAGDFFKMITGEKVFPASTREVDEIIKKSTGKRPKITCVVPFKIKKIRKRWWRI